MNGRSRSLNPGGWGSQYALDGRQGGSQRLSGHSEDGNISCTCRETNRVRPSRSSCSSWMNCWCGHFVLRSARLQKSDLELPVRESCSSPFHSSLWNASNIAPCLLLTAFMGENLYDVFCEFRWVERSYITFPPQRSVLPEYKHLFCSEDIFDILAAQWRWPS
jgi:hypothetical protein